MSRKVYAIYELQFPVMFGNTEIKQLELRRPTAGDMKAFDLTKWDVGMTIALVVKLASIDGDMPMSNKFVESMDFTDLTAIGELIVSWFPKPKVD